MFRHQPALAPLLLADALKVDVPAHEAVRLESAEFTDLIPTQYRADAVIVLSNDNGPVLAVVVEAQLNRDPDKCWRWPAYVIGLRSRLRCPALLLVVCVDREVADWSAKPIEIGHPGWDLVPLVLGPDLIPVLTPTQDEIPVAELAVLSAITHAGHPDCERILEAMLDSLRLLDEERAADYYDVAFAVLPEAASQILEALMTSPVREYMSDYARGYFAQGEATAILKFLDTRGIDVPEDARARISECRDRAQLDRWVQRAVTATTIEDFFAEA
jgi:hypothetical protein